MWHVRGVSCWELDECRCLSATVMLSRNITWLIQSSFHLAWQLNQTTQLTTIHSVMVNRHRCTPRFLTFRGGWIAVLQIPRTQKCSFSFLNPFKGNTIRRRVQDQATPWHGYYYRIDSLLYKMRLAKIVYRPPVCWRVIAVLPPAFRLILLR